MPITVSIVEDNEQLRATLARLISRSDGFQCLSNYGDAESALAALPGVKPEVVLVDISLPGMSGIECVVRLKRLLPRTPILMVTVHSDNDRLFQALQAGASGYLLKRTTPAELVAAIQDVLKGGAPMTGEIARRVIESFSHPSAAAADGGGLSDRENEVIGLLAQGYSDKEIAGRLQISFTTVRSHLAHIFEKLHVRSRVEAATWFVRAPKSEA